MGCEYLNDDEFVAAFQQCTLPKADFHHADHIRLAFLYVQRYGAEAEQRFLDGIRKLAASFGVSDKFHYTITIAWMRLVATHLEAAAFSATENYADSHTEIYGKNRSTENFANYATWIANNAGLLRKDLLSAHYSAERLASDAARAGWLEPDRVPLPARSSFSTVSS